MPARMSLPTARENSTLISPLPMAKNDVDADYQNTTVQIPDGCWEPVDFLDGDEANGVPSQLLATLYVNGCPMHFEAYLVDEHGELCDSRHQQVISLVKRALRDDETWNTFRYGNREYVMMAIPFGMVR